MSEVNKIARFVGIEACKSIFSEKSTFVLRSPEHYRRLYETNKGRTDKGDRNEGCAEKAGGGRIEVTSYVLSCWTILDENEPTSDEWDIFKEKDQNIVAIISTPSKVCKFLDESLDTNKEGANRRLPFYPVKHDKVNYDPVNNRDAVPFTKGKKFAEQKEYRFILEYARPPVIDSFIFCNGIDYMEKRFANPKMCKEQKNKLWNIIGNAGAGYGDFYDKKEMSDIIANADDLF